MSKQNFMIINKFSPTSYTFLISTMAWANCPNHQTFSVYWLHNVDLLLTVLVFDQL